jgi:alpha-tubulin suppressor-like RCC1 family protein
LVSGLSGVIGLGAGFYHSCAITSTDAWCWGSGQRGQVGPSGLSGTTSPVRVGLDEAPIAISGGDGFSCALTASGRVLCWGANDRGQLGDGSVLRQAAPRPVQLTCSP